MENYFYHKKARFLKIRNQPKKNDHNLNIFFFFHRELHSPLVKNLIEIDCFYLVGYPHICVR